MEGLVHIIGKLNSASHCFEPSVFVNKIIPQIECGRNVMEKRQSTSRVGEFDLNL